MLAVPRREAILSDAAARVALALLSCALGLLLLPSPAVAAITASRVTKPAASLTYALLSDKSASIAVAGTTNSTNPMADRVDLRCFFGDNGQSNLLEAGVPLAPDGSFAVPAADLSQLIAPLCRLRAVPAGTTSNEPAYRGPVIALDVALAFRVDQGASAGTLDDFFIQGQQRAAAGAYRSIGWCGLAASGLFDNAYGRTTNVFGCNAYLPAGNLDGVGNWRSAIRVDGLDAYVSASADLIFGSAPNPSPPPHGVPPLSVALKQDNSNGNIMIHESEDVARCAAGIPYPPTIATCAALLPTGVRVVRTITQGNDGHVVLISDAFSSTDGHKHAIDLLYANTQRVSTDATPLADVGYRFSGQKSYHTYARNDTVSMLTEPGSIYVKDVRADDGDPYTGQGAITYGTRPSEIRFVNPANYPSSDFTMRYVGTVPATGALSYTFVYSSELTAAAVTADANAAQNKLTPCQVPKLSGKTLTAAKQALGKAHCSLGKTTKKHSHSVPSGRVISSNPKAGTTGPNGGKVDLTISRG